MPTLNYPLEEEKYKAKVVFGLVKDENTGGDASAQFLNSQIADKRNQRNTLIENAKASGEFTDKDKESAKALEAEINDLSKSLSKFKGEKSSSQRKPTIQVSGDTVGLYLPMGLAFSDGVKYDNFDLGGAGAAMEAGLGFAESMMKGVGSFITNISGGGGTDLARLAGIQLSGKAGTFGDEVRAVQKLSGGLTLNPNERVLFDRPNMRTFSFTFKFIAKSQREAQEVENIVKFFRTELYPDDIEANVGETSIKLGYRFPNKFNISFEYGGEVIEHLHKIKPCFLQDVNTVYNASQMAMHTDGRFMEVDMTLTFRETKALSRKDVEGGY